jgi:hypothetical protein
MDESRDLLTIADNQITSIPKLQLTLIAIIIHYRR